MTRAADARPDREWVRLERLFSRLSVLPRSRRAPLLARIEARHPALLPALRELLDAHDALSTRASGHDQAARLLERLDSERASALVGAPDPATAPGARIGRYTVTRPLGRGGMGVVLLARDTALERDVALKLLPATHASGAAAARRLLDEARAASALDHPSIATVYEVGETADGRAYIAMAYVPGLTLRERLRDGPLAPREAAGIAAQIADGLAAAHARGIVHRDIKPENLIVDAEGRVRIVDFGVALLAGAATPAGGTAGTIAYMSPEQTRSDRVDHRTDLWSLGVVLYEMVTGGRPFAGDDRETLIRRIREGDREVPPRRGPRIPAETRRVIDHCLARRPAARPATAAEVRDALQAVVSPRRTVSPWLAATGYLAVSLGIVDATSRLDARYLLPEPTVAAVLVLLVAGFPAVVATALRAGGRAGIAPAAWPGRALHRLTWFRTVGVGAAAFAALIAISGFVVASGAPRVVDARGKLDALPDGGQVVIADLTSDPSDAGLAMALREALAVDLQQSGRFAVLGRAQVSLILARMDRPDSARLDVGLALEVAERAGAGAVLDLALHRVGGDYVLSGRALRPGTGEELFAVRTVAGEARLLGGMQSLSRAIRRRMGESREAIRRSRPLPDVTTPSLHALRFYAEAEQQAMRGNLELATALTGQALAADPDFAMAHRLAGSLASNTLRFGDARDHLGHAYRTRHRLSERERLHVEGIYYGAVALEPRRAADVYRLLVQRDPGDVRAANNLGSLLESWLDAPDEASRWFLHAAEAEPPLGTALAGAPRTTFRAGRPAEADSLATVAEARGVLGFAFRWGLVRAFATGDHAHVARACDALHAGTAEVRIEPNDREFCGSAYVAAGRLETAIPRLDEAGRIFLAAHRHRNHVHVRQSAALAHAMRDDPDRAAGVIRETVAGLPDAVLPEPDRFLTRVNLQVQAALLRRPDLVREIGLAYPPREDPDHWLSRLGRSLVAASAALEAGEPDRALQLLREAEPVGMRAQGWRIWEEMLRASAFEMLGQPDSAAVRYARAADPRYHVTDYLTKDRIHLPFALHRLARMEAARGDSAAAASAEARLRELLAGADPGIQVDVLGW
jgi:tetratricopeptide (TPR) repeat protein